MNKNLLTQFGAQSLKGWRVSFFISLCLTFVILLVIILKESPEAKSASLTPDVNTFKYTLNLIPPAQLGVKSWEIGDYSQYQFRTLLPQPPSPTFSTRNTTSPKTVEFHIVDELGKTDSHRYWLKITNMISFREFPGDIYQLVSRNDMRLTSENRRYELLPNYIPSKVSHYDQSTVPLAKLVKLGQAEVETQVGRFECIHYRAELGENLPTLEIWANAKIRPLGIVRVQSSDQILELISYGQKTDITVPTILQPVIQGISVLNHGCNSCHESENCHESIFPPR